MGQLQCFRFAYLRLSISQMACSLLPCLRLFSLKRCSMLLLFIAASLLSTQALALDLNHANEAELDGLKGMGPTLSRKVLAARQRQPFASWADFLQRVSGVGTAKAKLFSEQGLTIEGQAFVSAQTLP
jgi:competence protein ComEA